LPIVSVLKVATPPLAVTVSVPLRAVLGEPVPLVVPVVELELELQAASSAAAASVAWLRSPVAGRRGCPIGPFRTAAHAPARAVLVKCHHSSSSPLFNRRAAPVAAPSVEQGIII